MSASTDSAAQNPRNWTRVYCHNPDRPTEMVDEVDGSDETAHTEPTAHSVDEHRPDAPVHVCDPCPDVSDATDRLPDDNDAAH